MQMDCNLTEAKRFKMFPHVFKSIDINGRGLFSLCELRI